MKTNLHTSQKAQADTPEVHKRFLLRLPTGTFAVSFRLKYLRRRNDKNTDLSKGYQCQNASGLALPSGHYPCEFERDLMAVLPKHDIVKIPATALRGFDTTAGTVSHI